MHDGRSLILGRMRYARYNLLVNVISIDEEILGGTPVFAGTRVPVRTLTDYLEQHETIDTFLMDFPTVRHDQVIALLESSFAAAINLAA